MLCVALLIPICLQLPYLLRPTGGGDAVFHLSGSRLSGVAKGIAEGKAVMLCQMCLLYSLFCWIIHVLLAETVHKQQLTNL